MKRIAQLLSFVALLTAVALGLPGEAQAQAYNWSLLTADATGDVGYVAPIA